MESRRFVVDTNALTSRLLLPRSVPALAVNRELAEGTLLASEPTLEELAEVLSRSKFDPYVTIAERQRFLRLLGRIVQLVPIVHTIRACAILAATGSWNWRSTAKRTSSSWATATCSRSIPSAGFRSSRPRPS